MTVSNNEVIINGKNINRLNYIKIYIELEACPLLTPTERKILSDIISLSDKFMNTSGCLYTNAQLAHKHRTSSKTVTGAISKAQQLGFITKRRDNIKKITSSKNTSSYYSQRSLIMSIPEEWQFMGDLYNHLFVHTTTPNSSLKKCFREINSRLLRLKTISQNNCIQVISTSIDRYPIPFRLPPLYVNGITNKNYKRVERETSTLPVSPKRKKQSRRNVKLAHRLKTIVESQKKLSKMSNPGTWPEVFGRMMRADKIPWLRISDVLDWYADNICKQYVPEAFAANSFREKFMRIESAMDRQRGRPQKKGTAKIERGKYDHRTVKVNNEG